jgi:hypothetical protein
MGLLFLKLLHYTQITEKFLKNQQISFGAISVSSHLKKVMFGLHSGFFFSIIEVVRAKTIM